MHHSFAAAVIALSLACFLAPGARADVTPAALFTDHAVLQRDKPVTVWGKAAPGEKVTVSFAGQKREGTAGPDGHWVTYLEPLITSAQGTDLVIAGTNTITLRDVVVGEVWLCSGQSNMEWPVSRADDAAREIAAGQFPLIRQVRIEHTIAAAPADAVKTSGWIAAMPQAVGNFTAVGYFFARDVQQKLKVPVGIVCSAWGGTPIEAWMSPAALARDPAFAVVAARWQQAVVAFPARKVDFDTRLAAWIAAEAAAKAERETKAVPSSKKKTTPATKSDGAARYQAWLREHPRPNQPRGGPGDPWMPAGLFNGMINPLLPYALRGVLWYQGESNAARANEYHALFSAMIIAWRAHVGQGDIPFYWVNLANFALPADGGDKGRSYAFLREAQTRTLALPNTGQALAIDIGNAADIHPTNKQEVGRRLALLARNRLYGILSDDCGPTFAAARHEGAAMRVAFTHASGGLVAHEKPVQALELAGVDRIFHPADGRIDRETLVVTSPKVREPAAVRYAWTNAPEANLFNGAGLPATPFRSDDW